MNKVWRRILAVFISLLGVAAIGSIFVFGSVACIIVGTLVLIAGVALFQTADEAGYNANTGIAKMVEDAGALTLEEILSALNSLDTPFGKAWLGRVKLVRQPCIIFGPGADGSFVYIRRRARGVVISQCTSDFWLASTAPGLNEALFDAPEESRESTPWRFSADADALVNELYGRISRLAGR